MQRQSKTHMKGSGMTTNADNSRRNSTLAGVGMAAGENSVLQRGADREEEGKTWLGRKCCSAAGMDEITRSF